MTVKEALHLSFTWEQEKYQAELRDGRIFVLGNLAEKEMTKVSSLTEKIVEKLKFYQASSEKSIRGVLEEIRVTWSSVFGFTEETMSLLLKYASEDFVLIELKDVISRRRMAGFGWIGNLEDKVRLASLNPDQFVVLGGKTYIPLFVRLGAVTTVSRLVLNPGSDLYQGMNEAEKERRIVAILTKLQLILDKIVKGSQRATGDIGEGPVQHPLLPVFRKVTDVAEKGEGFYSEFRGNPRFASFLASWLCGDSIFTRLARTDAALASKGKGWKDLDKEIKSGRLGRALGVVQDGKREEGAKIAQMLVEEFRDAVSSEPTPLAQLTRALTFEPVTVALPKVTRSRK